MFTPNINNNPFPKIPSFPSYDLQNPSFTSHVVPPFFFPFTSPFPGDNRVVDDDTPLSQIFSQGRHLPGPPSFQGGKAADEGKNVIKKKRPAGSGLRRRAGKKDRHSKICTAQGVRDRRMRLSLHVARRFFDLQDMLGFDKASKTIEWLLSKSECAIKELITSSSSCSEEVNNKSEAAEGESVIFGRSEPMERAKEKVMTYEHCSNPITISPFLDQESNSYGTKENPDPLAWTDEYLLGGASSTTTKTTTTTSVFKYNNENEEKEEEDDDCNMIITNGSLMGFLGNYWEMAPF